MKLRKIAALFVAAGLAFGLVGAGIGATFNDTATGIGVIRIGTFGVEISGGVQSDNNHTVTFTCPLVVSSDAGRCEHDFTIHNVGTIPAHVVITLTATTNGADGLSAGWGGIMASPTTIAAGAGSTFVGGLYWPVLTNDDLGDVVTFSYHVVATA